MLYLFPLLHFSRTQLILTDFNSIRTTAFLHFPMSNWDISSKSRRDYTLISILRKSWTEQFLLWRGLGSQISEQKQDVAGTAALTLLCCSRAKVRKRWRAWHRHTDQLRVPWHSPRRQPLGLIDPFVEQDERTILSPTILKLQFYYFLPSRFPFSFSSNTNPPYIK